MAKVVDKYPEFLQEYLDIFEPVFRKAFETSEFNLIMSLLAYRGESDAGWDPYENTEDVFEEAYKQQKKFKRSLKINMNLWLYAHLVECSEHYELLANLIKTIKGEDYNIANHVNRNFVNLKVREKINRLKSIARGTNYENVYEPFDKTFNARFRNAIGHADYAVKKGANSGVTVSDNAGFPKIFDEQETNDLINRALALHVSIRALRKSYIAHYDKSVVMPSSPTFGGGRPVDVTLIVRKGHGVIGLRCIGGHDDGVPFETRVSRCLPYEQKMIEQGVNELPRSRAERANNILKFLPAKVARKVMPRVQKMIDR